MPETSSPDDSLQFSLDELIPLTQAAKLSGLSASHLRLLLRTGEMQGKKMGRDWFTTPQAIKEYLARNRRPGPKPRTEPD